MTTRVTVLTPPGTGAIATVEVRGPWALEVVEPLFRPVGSKPLSLELHNVRFGRLGGGDEVVVAVKQVEPEPVVEVHCHGGRRVVRWVVERFTDQGCVEEPPADDGWTVLTRAKTLRTASILLDQCHGAFDRAVAQVVAAIDSGEYELAARLLTTLADHAPLGRHLVEPWRVVVAGPPNVGKSSLVNALAGYQRSVVSATAGTTRDVVTTAVAFDGWPVELADTAGLRRAAEALEASGIDLARRFLRDADLVVWVLDAAAPEPVWPTGEEFSAESRVLHVLNKTDLPVAGWVRSGNEHLPRVSATTGAGVPELAAAIAGRLVPAPPAPGEAVPYTAALADRVGRAARLVTTGRVLDARKLLTAER